MDYVSMIETGVTIVSLGAFLYTQYRANAKGHKTTQGKVDAAAKTVADNQTAISRLESSIETMAKDIADLKVKP